MTGRHAHKKGTHAARPIKLKRDFEAASAAAKRLAAQAVRDAEAEARLQSLLHEMDQFDEPDDDAPEDEAESFSEPGPMRRWSDGGPEDT